jgi:pyruvate kinase
LTFALEQGADWIALSFVQRPEDVAEARRLMGGMAALMAKIEKPAAVERLEEIIELADGIMVARGDLGVELNPEEVPPIQKRIVAKPRASGQAGGGRHANARIDDRKRRRRPAPKCRTWPMRSMTARMR